MSLIVQTLFKIATLCFNFTFSCSNFIYSSSDIEFIFELLVIIFCRKNSISFFKKAISSSCKTCVIMNIITYYKDYLTISNYIFIKMINFYKIININK